MDDAGTIDEMAGLYERSSVRKEELIRAASFNRVIARTIDLVIVLTLMEIIPGVGYFTGFSYLLLADGLFKGRSIGKKLLGIRVVISDKNSEEALESSYKESVFRNFPFAAAYLLAGICWNIPAVGGLLSFIVVAAVLVLESLIMLGSENGKRFGDEIAKTQVVIDKQGGVNVS